MSLAALWSLLQGALPVLAALGAALFGVRWLRKDAAKDAKDELVKEIEDADQKRARDIRDAVAAARRGGGVQPDDDTRGYRD